MSADEPMNIGDLARQARHHLNSLKEAGVEWLPRAELPPPAPRADAAPPALRPADTSPAPTAGPPPEELPALVEAGALFTPEASPELPAEARRQALELLAEQVSTCSRCPELLVSRTQTVFGDGPLDAELCFIGEAPGFNEDKQGRPFVGEAGQLLDKIIAACGFQRSDVYIANILKCRPPGNRTPLLTEAEHCRGYLERQLELVRPKYICCLGACAAQNLLATTLGIGRLRRRFHDYNGTPVLCTYHPAYLLRNPTAKKDVWEDMKMLLVKMGRGVPGK